MSGAGGVVSRATLVSRKLLLEWSRFWAEEYLWSRCWVTMACFVRSTSVVTVLRRSGGEDAREAIKAVCRCGFEATTHYAAGLIEDRIFHPHETPCKVWSYWLSSPLLKHRTPIRLHLHLPMHPLRQPQRTRRSHAADASLRVGHSGCHVPVPSLCKPHSLKSGISCWTEFA